MSGRGEELTVLHEKLQWVSLELDKEIAERKGIENLLRLVEEALAEKETQLALALQDVSLVQASLIEQEKLAAMGRMVAGVTHEINNPLAFIKMNAEFLSILCDRQVQQGLMPSITKEQYKRPVQAVIRGVERIANIVSGLKFFSRQEQREKTGIQLAKCLEDAWALVKSNKELSSAIEMKATIGADVMVYGNVQQVEQVLINLLHNALKALYKGMTQQGYIWVNAYQEAAEVEWVLITVADNGCGIPQSSIPKIFEPFYTSDDENGTGLGLSIVQGIVQEHGGTIGLVSVLGQGTTFTIKLPTWRLQKGDQ